MIQLILISFPGEYLINLRLAVYTGVAIFTETLERLDSVQAKTSIEARTAHTVINVVRAADAGKAGGTQTNVGEHAVHTCCTILTRTKVTVVQIDLTVDAGPTFVTETLKRVDTVIALAGVAAWRRGALFDVLKARFTCKPCCARTNAIPNKILTRTTVVAAQGDALVNVFFTLVSLVAHGAGANKVTA